MEEQAINKIEQGIRRIIKGTGTAKSEKLGIAFKLLKPLNVFMYEDLLDKYKKALEFRDKKMAQ